MKIKNRKRTLHDTLSKLILTLKMLPSTTKNLIEKISESNKNPGNISSLSSTTNLTDYNFNFKLEKKSEPLQS